MVSRKRCLDLADEVEKAAHRSIECNAEEDYVANLEIARALRAYAGLMENDPTVTEDDIEKVSNLSHDDIAKYVKCLGQRNMSVTPGNGMPCLPSRLIAFESAFRLGNISAALHAMGRQRDEAELAMYSAQAEVAQMKRGDKKDGK